MSTLNSYLNINFKNLKLERPLFYSWNVGIRFEIGPSDIGVWKDFDNEIINNNYFSIANEKAIKIFDNLFQDQDEIIFVYQHFSDGRKKIKKGSYILQQINDLDSKHIVYSNIKDIYDLDKKRYCFKRLSVCVCKNEINYQSILEGMINTDFRIRKPSIYGDCFFINKSKNIILFLYDDRGMDVIAKDKTSLMNLYSKFNEWILDSDRENIDAVFS